MGARLAVVAGEVVDVVRWGSAWKSGVEAAGKYWNASRGLLG